LLRLLNLPSAEPATLIGVLYPHPEFRPLTDSLIDLEEDLPTLAVVVAELRRMEREDYLHALGSGTMGRTHVSSVPDRRREEPTRSGDQVSAGTLRIPRGDDLAERSREETP